MDPRKTGRTDVNAKFGVEQTKMQTCDANSSYTKKRTPDDGSIDVERQSWSFHKEAKEPL